MSALGRLRAWCVARTATNVATIESIAAPVAAPHVGPFAPAIAAGNGDSDLRRAAPSEVAAAMLSFCQGEQGRVGVIVCTDLQKIWADVAIEMGVEMRDWRMVSNEFRRLINDPKKDVRRLPDGTRRVVYVVPAAAAKAPAPEAPRMREAA